MLPALQPKRPKHPQQTPQTTYAPQQKRHPHEQHYQSAVVSAETPPPKHPQNAMPQFAPGQTGLMPPRSLYDSAVRHPVFFTQQLRKPPFPIPQVGPQAFSPVASGYVPEANAPGTADKAGNGKTKL
ncbi:hypothetical protein M011DRAFT_438081 [Sporormia fimetaria CBS 119925]|uniref:Uncharacterized protein n=1 Tax=Sporormia fimetaria CBS 119925 TaxID=1340428 RepID=A0A6A6VK47_9PLEO|nr:hypothetical protein M011DRAFT_438081 [Sporormia fimetaria CBS 119925]